MVQMGLSGGVLVVVAVIAAVVIGVIKYLKRKHTSMDKNKKNRGHGGERRVENRDGE